MSLEARILALAQLVGGDIKALQQSSGGGGSGPMKTINGQSLSGTGNIVLPLTLRNRIVNGNNESNQHNFNGNWTSISNGTYGYDRWKRNGTANKIQVVEAGSFTPSTVHTLSGTGVTTQQITSPANGNWTITVPNGATKVMLEEGTVATPYEILHPALRMALLARYFQWTDILFSSVATAANQYFVFPIPINGPMRATPTVSWAPYNGPSGFINTKDEEIRATSAYSAYIIFQSVAAGPVEIPYCWVEFSAEL